MIKTGLKKIGRFILLAIKFDERVWRYLMPLFWGSIIVFQKWLDDTPLIYYVAWLFFIYTGLALIRYWVVEKRKLKE